MKREKLRQARITKGLSQKVAAELVGVSRNAWSLWELGKEDPYPVNVKELCTFFGVKDPGELDMERRQARTEEPPLPNKRPKQEQDFRKGLQQIPGEGLSKVEQSVNDKEKILPSTMVTELPTSSLFLVPTAMALPERVVETLSTPDCATWFGLKLAEMITLVHQWSGMATFSSVLQSKIDQEIKSLDRLKDQFPVEAFSLSRRSFLIALASLPSALLVSSKQGHKLVLSLEELLPQCATSLTACWHLSSGNHLESIPPILDSYLPTLITVVENASSYRELAADLVAQCYFLKTIPSWHIEGLDRAESFCIQALRYSEIAKNTNLRLNALNQHALISYYAKQFPKALAKSEEAASILDHESHDYIFFIVRGRVYMYLAAIQASNQKKQAEQTLEQAKQAFALQSTIAEPAPLYADCGDAPLTLWDGLTYYHLSFHNIIHAQRALISLKTFGQLHSDTTIPERFRLECLNNRVLAATQCNEMEEAVMCWEMGKQGARTLESKQRNQEADFAYQAMLKQWPKETRILNLIHGCE